MAKECSICYEEECTHTKKLLCGHEFCVGCSKEWFLKSEDPRCPMCRRPFWFRGLSRSSWLKEKREGNEDPDGTFPELFDMLLEECMEHDEPSFVIMQGLMDLQSTYNVITKLFEFDKYQAYYYMCEEYSYLSWARRSDKWYYVDEPIAEKPTLYPVLNICGTYISIDGAHSL